MKRLTAMMSLRKASAILQAAVIASVAMLPALLYGSTASGAQLTDRYIDLSSVQSSGGNSTEGSGRDGGDAAGQDVTYTVGFTVQTTGNIGGIAIDFCGDSPITGDTCTAPTGFNVNEGTLLLANQTGITDFQIDAATDSNTLILTRTGGAQNVNNGVAVELDLGSTAAANGITNPTSVGAFYGRILTYATTGAAQGYTDSTVPGAFVDDGGIAMAIANELTVTARVQEVLEFCIGTDDDSSLANIAGDDCTDVSGTDLDLEVVDSNTIATTSNISDPNDGVVLIRTNAANGAVIYYKSEQDTSSGKLKIAGGTCVGTNFDDPCFNSTGTTQNAIVAGTEEFGMTLRDLNTTSGGATTAVTCNAEYDGDGSCSTGAVTGYAWDDTGSFDVIASSAGPIDDEKASVEFAATASPTTPTGLYTVTANFVATSTF